MGDEDIFPSTFYSKAPIHEKVTLIPLRNNQFYWMLSLDTGNNFNDANSKQNTSKLAPYEDNEGDLVDCFDLEDNFEINPTKSGKYITTFYVPQQLHAAIVGPRGSKLRELQERTNTLIKVPKPNESAIVKITGQSERSVASARTQIAILLLTKREKLPITHFVSIPMYSREIDTNFNIFKQEILNGPSTRGIDPSIFQKLDKFHLTITTIALLDDREIEEGKITFGKCQELFRSYFQNKKPKICLKGVEIMNDDPSDVDVLYGNVCIDDEEQTRQFQSLANEIFDTFTRTGLVRKQYDNVKLHVTLMNSLFRKSDGYQSSIDKNSKRESFDASYILNKYRDFHFGYVDLNEIHLSIRFTTSKNGYYDATSVITI